MDDKGKTIGIGKEQKGALASKSWYHLSLRFWTQESGIRVSLPEHPPKPIVLINKR